jgi:hypothetical protein
VTKLAFTLSLLVLATFPFALGCSNNTCGRIPDGTYTETGPDGGPPVALVVPLALDGALIDAALLDGAAPDAALPGDAAAHDAAPRDAGSRDAGPRDAATPTDAGHDAGHDAATAHDASVAHDAATTHDAAIAHDAGIPRDAATTVDAGTMVDAGGAVDAGGTVGPRTFTFHGGLPEPYDTWDCTKPALSCVMSYVCKHEGETVSVVTSYSPGAHPTVALSITPAGASATIVRLEPQTP